MLPDLNFNFKNHAVVAYVEGHILRPTLNMLCIRMKKINDNKYKTKIKQKQNMAKQKQNKKQWKVKMLQRSQKSR